MICNKGVVICYNQQLPYLCIAVYGNSAVQIACFATFLIGKAILTMIDSPRPYVLPVGANDVAT